MEFNQDNFKKLWNVNPKFDSNDHNFENTYYLLESEINSNRVTPDGHLVTFELIFNRYKRYCQVRNAINDATKPEYRKKENQIAPLAMYIFNELYMSDKVPTTSRHYYFWGELTEDEITEKINNFMQLRNG